MASTKKRAVRITTQKLIELPLNFTVAIPITLASPVTKKKDATLHRFGRCINFTKKPCYAGPAEMNLPSMNIQLATLHVHLARVHLILAVALISICILKCKSIADAFDALTSTRSYRSDFIEPYYIIQCSKALIYDAVLRTNMIV